MKKFKILFQIIKKLAMSAYFFMWQRRNSRSGNVHLGMETMSLKKIPFSSDSVFIRPTISDVVRVAEFNEGIYFENSYLHKKLLDFSPTVLIDIGANIGLSSLCILNKINSINKVIGIEAEKLNYDVLRMNYKYWSEINHNVSFDALFGVASWSSTNPFKQNSSLHSLNESYTASGSFRFSVIEMKEENNEQEVNLKAISISDIVSEIGPDKPMIMKIDIEGGEEHLFKDNIDWVSQISFITIELHDCYNQDLLNSSKNLLKVLCDYNFAIVPKEDVLHCYNRNILFENK